MSIQDIHFRYSHRHILLEWIQDSKSNEITNSITTQNQEDELEQRQAKTHFMAKYKVQVEPIDEMKIIIKVYHIINTMYKRTSWYFEL